MSNYMILNIHALFPILSLFYSQLTSVDKRVCWRVPSPSRVKHYETIYTQEFVKLHRFNELLIVPWQLPITNNVDSFGNSQFSQISKYFKFVTFVLLLAATKQLYKWFSSSVCPSHLFDYVPSLYHHDIFRSYYQWQKWWPCTRSRSEVKGQGHRDHNPT